MWNGKHIKATNTDGEVGTRNVRIPKYTYTLGQMGNVQRGKSWHVEIG